MFGEEKEEEKTNETKCETLLEQTRNRAIENIETEIIACGRNDEGDVQWRVG